MVNCWASELNNCCSNASKEHLVSASLFKNKIITVQGFEWCENEPMQIGISSLTSKILCKHHNNLLSDLDIAAGHAFNIFEYISNLVEEANKKNKGFKVKQTNINALLLERWLLKTLINLCYKKSYFIGNSNEVALPEKNLVEICFGQSSFSGGAGMYVAANTGDRIGFGPQLSFTPLIEESENRVVAGMFKFAGILIFLWLKREQLPNNFDWIKDSSGSQDWKNVQPSRPFRRIKFRVANGKTHTLYFNWK